MALVHHHLDPVFEQESHELQIRFVAPALGVILPHLLRREELGVDHDACESQFGERQRQRQELLVRVQPARIDTAPLELAPAVRALAQPRGVRLVLREPRVVRQPHRADDPPARVAVDAALVTAGEHRGGGR
jgi:hypothetical protein